MHWHLESYQIALLLMAVWGAVLAVAAERRSVAWAMPLSRLLAALSAWSFGYACELMARNLETKVVWSCVTYLAIVIVPVAWLLFSLCYAGNSSWLAPARQGALVVVPAITTVLAWTNSLHGLMWRDAHLVPYGNLLVTETTRGPAFWVHAAYSYLLIVAGAVVLARSALRSSGLHRRQSLVLLAACVPPMMANVSRLAGLRLFGPLDVSAFAFAASASVFTWALLRLRFFDVLPLAKGAILQIMSEGVVVLDQHGRLLDANPAARDMLGLELPLALGDSLATMWPEAEAFLDGRPTNERKAELVSPGRTPALHLEAHLSPILRRGRPQGYLLVLRDVSERRRQEQALAESEARHRGIVQAQTEVICHLLPDGTVTFVNDAFCRYFGTSADEARLHGLSAYMSEPDRAYAEQALAALRPD